MPKREIKPTTKKELAIRLKATGDANAWDVARDNKFLIPLTRYFNELRQDPRAVPYQEGSAIDLDFQTLAVLGMGGVREVFASSLAYKDFRSYALAETTLDNLELKHSEHLASLDPERARNIQDIGEGSRYQTQI